MLLRLMRKDLILHWRGVLPLPLTALGLLVYAALRDVEDLDPGMVLAVGALMAAFTPVSVAAREERFRSASLTACLPVSRVRIVLARYLGAWILLAAVAAASVGLLALIRGPAVLPALLGPRSAFAALTAYTLALGIMMPLVQRFGFTGVLVALVALQLLGLVALVATMLLPGRPWISEAVRAIRALADLFRSRLGAAAAGVLFALALAAVNLASLGVAVAQYRRKEL